MARNYTSNEEVKDDSDKDLLAAIKENFKTAQDAYSEQRQQAREDFQFRAGDQWPDQIRQERQSQGRPCLSINKLPQFIKQIVNNQKINRPSINVNPNDSAADIAIARVLQAIIKNIESRSMAENAYDTAFDSAVTCGEGYFRIITEYADELSFDQEISIRAIDNCFSVYLDPDFKSDLTGINWAFITDDMERADFERLYPNSECASGSMFVNTGDSWIREDQVRVAEYFYIDYEEIDIVLTKSGMTMKKSDYETHEGQVTAEQDPIVRERTSRKPIVRWVKTNGHEILERTVFPGAIIPIVPVFADTYIKEGKRMFEGIIRQAKDAQRAYNFWYSAETEMIALAPKATYIGVEGQFEGHEGQWANANSLNLPYLEYKPVSSGGQQAPAPVRTQFDPQIQSITLAKQSANEDLKSTTGIYDPSLGAGKPEASGRALITKQRQGEMNNFMYGDNLCKALKHAGGILVGMIPPVYDTKRVIRIVGDVNEKDEVIVINSFDEETPIFLDIGKYAVEISIGPYGENQRQDAIDSMLALMQVDPNLVGIIGDIFVSKMDWDGASKVAERMKIMLPAPLQEGNQELPPEVQAQVAKAQMEYEQKIADQEAQLGQMQQLIANLTSEANKALAEAHNKTAELLSKERMNAEDNRTRIIVEQMKQQGSDGRLSFSEELAFAMGKNKLGPVVPEQGDTLVLSGVNDPITEAQDQAQGDMTPEEEAALLQKLDNFTPQSTQM